VTAELTAYCVRCRAKQPIHDPEATFSAPGRPMTRGTCPVCGAGLARFGRTPAHNSLPAPAAGEPLCRGNLVIVESPAKARTVGRLLGRNYHVVASVGHVRDLLRSQLAVDIDNDFAPTYRVPNDKRQLVKQLAAEVAAAETVYLATDPDREGEAIAWHLAEATKLDPDRILRVVFHEITPDAVSRAFANPAGLDMNLVSAQQARRILDRLVGYQISPLLWERVRNRLTAGRVQSVAVRLVVERENEIATFQPREYWTLDAELAQRPKATSDGTQPFRAGLQHINGKAVDLQSDLEVTPILNTLQDGHFRVDQVKTGQRQRKPKPPFTTSTLQQAASARLRYRPARTMRVAQQLYEGLDLGEGEPAGLITYMRTDSTSVSHQSQMETRTLVEQLYGHAYLPAQPPHYKTRTKGAQEAHEAIRPTRVHLIPAAAKDHLSRDQYALYQLIWQRFVASQMVPALFDTQSVDILAGSDASNMPYLFRASGSCLAFAGYLKAYRDIDDEQENLLPPLKAGEELDLVQLLPQQHFTEPPPRYTEATLIQALEENGIGRPSTYASILATIQERGYVETTTGTGRNLRPTEIGLLVDGLLATHFPEIISTEFTSEMEANLDQVAAGDLDWISAVRQFYEPFSARLVSATENLPENRLADQPVGRTCPACASPLVVKYGRYGQFIACSSYPACRHTESASEKAGVACPQCSGDLVLRRSRRGRPFYGCSNYPGCTFSSWKRPLPTPCPNCGGLLVVQSRGAAQCLACRNEYAQEGL